jgi:UDP-N-acetylglucosamine 1-carboxyvinyltransferase
MGINTKVTDKTITFNTDKIKPVHYTFSKPSHTVTETLIMAATFADGQSILDNAAREPEIDDLISMLNDMGGQIKRDLTNPKRIIINGVKSLKGTNHQIIPDRNEVVTFACAALATKGSVNILHCNPATVKIFIDTINKMGAETIVGNDELTVSWTKPLKNIDIETGPEPGFMTDWQAVFSILLTQTVGVSSIIERVYPSRFQHIDNLKKMGVKVAFFNPSVPDPKNYYQFNPKSDDPNYFHGVKIYGPAQLKPAKFTINDLRAGASVTLAALTAKGTSTIDGVEYIERGYEKLAERLSALGANIEYIKT